MAALGELLRGNPRAHGMNGGEGDGDIHWFPRMGSAPAKAVADEGLRGRIAMGPHVLFANSRTPGPTLGARLAHRQRQGRVPAQGVVVVQIFVAQRQCEDALGQEFRQRVFDEGGVAEVGETLCEPSDEFRPPGHVSCEAHRPRRDGVPWGDDLRGCEVQGKGLSYPEAYMTMSWKRALPGLCVFRSTWAAAWSKALVSSTPRMWWAAATWSRLGLGARTDSKGFSATSLRRRASLKSPARQSRSMRIVHGLDGPFMGRVPLRTPFGMTGPLDRAIM